MTLRFLIILFTLLAAGAAHAHDARPLAVEIREIAQNRFALSWHAPGSVAPENAPRLALGAPCRAIAPAGADDPLRGRAIYACDNGLKDAELTIEWPYFNPSLATLVRVAWRSGEVSTEVLDPSTTSWRAPARETFAGVSKSYFILGVKHILTGVDHILFLAGLIVLARTPGRVLVTATGFTLAHSLTLALVALDLARVSVPVVETLIALSIVFVAAEIARGDRTTLAWRRPVLVASTFGLLHGAGFAAALREIGLPQTERAPALFFFNVGVEAGQLIIIAAIFAAVTLARRAAPGAAARLPLSPERAAGYAIGVLSAYWLAARAAVVLA
ncbi:MAG: HupE/UreJ family protein [Alphaproteobacteria bacterium]|nr:HupE/UreJ family protein [Alphaproteobacteria bacterium]